MADDAPRLTNHQAAILADWQNAAIKLKEVKDVEAAARQAVTEAFFAAESAIDGTAYFPLLQGYRLKGVFKTNYTVRKGDHEAVILKLQEAGEAGEHATKAFAYDIKLSMTHYKNLLPSMKAIVDECVTSSPGVPTYEIVAPKEDK